MCLRITGGVPATRSVYDGETSNTLTKKVRHILNRLPSLMRSPSTCKRLANLCAPTLFHTITNGNRSPEKLTSLLDYLTNIGCFVKRLILKLDEQGRDDPILAEIVKKCSDLRHLTIDYYREDTSDRVLLLAAFKTLPALTGLSINELTNSYWSRLVMDEDNFVHKTFKPMLESHRNLRSLKVSGYRALESGGYASLIHDAPRLIELALRGVIHLGLRNSLADTQTWACATHLQSLTFVQCSGLHVVIFTQMLASGVFGHPKKVTLEACGDRCDDREPPRPFARMIPPLDILELDNFEAWEMEHLQLIHAKVVFLSRVWRRGPEEMYKLAIQQISDRRAFPAAAEIHVTNDWSDGDFGELQRVCSTRGVKLVAKDWEGSLKLWGSPLRGPWD